MSLFNSLLNAFSFRELRRQVEGAALVEPLEDRCMLADILGSAASFAALAGTTVANTGSTAIAGNVGAAPGTSITGFPPGNVSGGTLNADTAAAVQAQAALVTAYNGIAGETAPVGNNLSGDNLGGLTLTPGVYHFTSAAALTGTLTLNAQGNPNARFDFQIGSSLTTATGATIDLINGAEADNVYFQVGGSATLGTSTAFAGNILADQSIALGAGATLLEGRALAIAGGVTLDDNQIIVPQADVSVTNTTVAGPVLAGNAIAYTVTVANAGLNAAQNVVLTDAIPVDTTFVSDAQISGPALAVTNPAVGATGTISGTIANLPSGDSASFTIVALVSPSTPAAASIVSAPTVTADTYDPNLANNIQTVTTSVQTQADGLVTNTTAAGPVHAGSAIVYTVTVANAGPSDAQTVALSDVVPAGTTFFSDAQISGPTFTVTSPAVGATGTINATIGTLPSGDSARFTIVALVPSSTPAGASIVNTAAVTSVTSDLNLVNNIQTVTNSVLAAPSVSAVIPSSGLPAGGTLVTITGTNFVAGATVDFGTTPATNVTVVNSTTITANDPAGTGAVDITVSTAGGSSITSPADRFTYSDAPSITSLASDTFTVGVADTFTITSAAIPTAAMSESGALPAGITFTDNLNGTATLAGTPTAATSGTYDLTLGAANGVLPAASQSFVLTVSNIAPAGTVVAGKSVPPIAINPTAAFGQSSAADKKLTFTVVSDSGAGSTVLTKTIRVKRGTATLTNLNLHKAGTYNVVISDSLGNSTTEQVTIVGGAGRKLVFTAPVTTLATPQSVSVAVFDQYGNSTTAADGTAVTLQLAPRSMRGAAPVLTGTLTSTLVNGVATFADVSISGTGKAQLFASAAKLRRASSAVFLNA